MEEVQAATFDPTPEEVAAVNVVTQEDIKLQQQQWVDYKAVGGLLTVDYGEHRTGVDKFGNPVYATFKRMTVTEFAEKIGVERSTLYRWEKSIPNFWELVRERRRVLMKQSRATQIYNGLFLKASKGEPAAVKLWAEIFDDYQPPAQAVKHELGDSMADALGLAKKRREAIEAEVVREQPTDGRPEN